MLFNSPVFPLFFGLVYLLYRFLPRKGQNLLLLGASWFFYGWWDWRFLGLILASTAVDYLCGLALERRRHKLWVGISVLVNLGILAVFKYLDFFLTEVNRVFDLLGLDWYYPMAELILPVGLSFYTFQSMAYTIDVYRGKVKARRDPLTFALFVSFFPQLVAGPIERSDRLMPQLENTRHITRRQLAEGGYLVLWGFFKKLFVADNLAVIVKQVFDGDASPSGFLVLIGAYAFTWQIYCDFSGYTDIARGLAKLMGIELSVNFRLPFFARSPRDLWRRWHISLSEWLRDYLYIPLGGNRKGRARTQLNLLLTMLLGGLWHGANWTFVAWGAWHGVALAIERLVSNKPLARFTETGPLPDLEPERGGVARWLGVLATFHFTVAGFVIFRAHSLGQVGELATALVTRFTPQAEDRWAATQLLVLVSVPLAKELWQHLRGDDLQAWLRLPTPVQLVGAVAMVLAIAVLGATYGQQFIYFQF